MDHTTACILAGGPGMRLRAVVHDRCKVMAPLAGRPFLTYVLDQVLRLGIREAVLCTGYRGQHIRQTLGEQYRGLRLRYSQEADPLGTGGALRLAMDHVHTPRVLVLSGASLCPADLDALAAWHGQRQARATMLLAQVPDAAQRGRVRLDDLGLVLGFEERRPDPAPGLAAAGVYLLSPSMLRGIPADRAVSLEREVLPRWVPTHLLWGYPTAAPLIDLSTPQAYAAAEAALSRVTLA